ncbi:hypothetical protein RFI_12775 [Reticulomyxa filosa]|uniref:Kelch motif family protein n=1 Tax=Reticulomyxa filosa TaxID=46433 RepID=X6NDK8_RETFI|nr:hypothetical protein RFI_12775 [Reticulomyxa filosa]|eukprot:ETO24380.1 hypothetical protein RFI_12775 [Reticulomyxa filosa]
MLFIASTHLILPKKIFKTICKKKKKKTGSIQEQKKLCSEGRMKKQSYQEQIKTQLPASLCYPQCVVFNDEILICGAYGQPKCYSFHVKQSTYKEICSYPSNVGLLGHSVVECNDESSDNDEKMTTLLSFGGEDKHTFVMKYKSVWDEKEPVKDMNRWSRVKNRVVFGFNRNERDDNLCGARGLISGYNKNLLFVVYPPNEIDVIDLSSYEYVPNVSNKKIPQMIKSKRIEFSSFVPMTKYGKQITNEFILTCEELNIWIKYDEMEKTFLYKFLPTFCLGVPLSFCGYTYIYDHILLFGGLNHNASQRSNSISAYDMKNQQWSNVSVLIPQSISSCAVVISPADYSLHIIGGRTYASELNSHYIIPIDKIIQKNVNVSFFAFVIVWLLLSILFDFWFVVCLQWTIAEIRIITGYWQHKCQFHRLGWIYDFEKIILLFLK